MSTSVTDTTSATSTSSLLSGSINFTGLGSGTDFNTIIDQLVKIESINKTRLETWKSTWQSKIDSMRALNQRMDSIEQGAAALDTATDFNARQASSSDTGVVTATANNTAANGAYQVTVATDAKHILRAAGVASAATVAVPAGASTLRLTVGGVNHDVALAGGETLTGLMNAINAQAGAFVTATIEDDGTTSRAQHLVIKSVTGGSAGVIGAALNPTNLSFDSKDVALNAYNTWSGTSTVGLLGQFTGAKADAQNDDYTFTIVGNATIGTDAFTINWSSAARGTSGTISVPAGYVPGTELQVENGFSITLASGTVVNNDQFTVRAYANDIDEAETGTWSGPAITTTGNYLGTTSKTYNFTVTNAATLGSGTAVLRWTDSTGRSGTVSVAAAGTDYAVDQGLKLNFAAGSLVSGNTFSVNVFAPDQQQGQDKGLAQVAKVVHAGFDDADSSSVTSSDGTFSYTYAGKAVTVNITSGTTLNGLAAAINADANNAGVAASVINDGMGLPTSYKLVLTGKNSGAQNQITNVTHTLTNLLEGGNLGGGFDLTQKATNSMSKVDGYPSQADIYLQRSTNQISDVITGVTVNLVNSGTAVVSVSTDTNAILGKIEALVNAVNYAQSYIRDATKYDAGTGEAGILVGNYAYYIIKSRIDTALNTSISGLIDGEDTYVNLAQVGIHTDPDNDGVWTIDAATLQNALDNDPDAVANLFINNTTKGSIGAAKRMYDEMVALTDSQSGMLNVLINNYNGIITNIDNKIDSEDKRLELYRQNLTERFARLETNLGQLNAQSKAIESAIAQLPKSS